MKKIYCCSFFIVVSMWLFFSPLIFAGTSSLPGGKIRNNGVIIDYTDTGSKDTALLFIHGWCMNKTYWNSQAAYFAGRYRVVTIDLPGFGASGRNRHTWTPEAYGMDIIAVIRQLDLHHVILVGHSTSGAAVLEAALLSPERIAGLIGVDNFKDIGQTESPEELQDEENFYAAARLNFKSIAQAYANGSLFSPSTGPQIRKKVLVDIAHSDSLIAVECLRQSNRYPYSQKLASLKFRLYLINSDLSPTDTLGLEKIASSYKLLTLHGCGHYPMIEDPDQFNVLMEEALSLIKHG